MLAIRRLWQRLFHAFDAQPVRAEPSDARQHTTRPSQHEPVSGAARLVVSRRLFQLSPELLAALRATRPWCDYEDRLSWEHDAFLLDPRDDQSCYLSADGRLLWLERQASLAATRGRALAALVVGARQTGVTELLALLPARSAAAETCAPCRGAGFRSGGPPEASRQSQTHASEGGAEQVCQRCAGLGWTSPELDLQASVSA
jgi:hypothetical protein